MTADQIRAKFRREGRTLKDFAQEHNFRANDVYKVLSGQYKGYRGRAHKIAVLLGLKPGAESQA